MYASRDRMRIDNQLQLESTVESITVTHLYNWVTKRQHLFIMQQSFQLRPTQAGDMAIYRRA